MGALENAIKQTKNKESSQKSAVIIMQLDSMQTSQMPICLKNTDNK